MSQGGPFDVVIVGASIAGCTAATFLGRRGLRVLVVERASARNAYKRVCTHFIQPCGTPTLERLGVVERMEAAGAVRNSIHTYTPFRMHYELNNRVSLATPFNVIDRFVYGASVRDPRVAREFQRLGARLVHPTDIIRPRLLARALWAQRPTWLGGDDLRVV